jgi:hypothetical protein
MSRSWPLALLGVACVLAVFGARPYAGSWNDGSRLATVESLVDRRTFIIDDSIFVRAAEDGSPYDPRVPILRQGTRDLLFINGHFYSDKPPVSAVLLAGLYQVLQWATGLVARDDPQRFCYLMNLAGAGLPYVVAVWSIVRIGALLVLSSTVQLLLAASFAFATVAPAYAQHVNGHIELLAATALVYVLLLPPVLRSNRVILIGAWLGAAYALDLAAGPLLVICTLPFVGARAGWRAGVLCCAAALPGILLHHLLAYAIAGTLLPANLSPEYFRWVGSPFDSTTMTGVWHHTPGHLLTYAVQLLAGRRGFLFHNLPLLLIVIAAPALLRRSFPERFAVVHAVGWSAATWLVYAISSTNYSGQCLSIRWFVPLLIPGYVVLGVIVRDRPRHRFDFALLSGWGALLAGVMWNGGPWSAHRVPWLWTILAAALLSCAAVRMRAVESVSARVTATAAARRANEDRSCA